MFCKYIYRYFTYILKNFKDIENKINEFHLNSISNGFSGSYIVNFNNGVPNDQIKDEIEDAFGISMAALARREEKREKKHHGRFE